MIGMSGFGHLKVDGFRRLCGIDLELRRLSVLIGANGSGKTSLLDVFSLLAASAQSKLREKLSELSGLPAIMTSGRTDGIALGLSMEVASHEPLKYELRIAPMGTAYTLESETLTQRRTAAPEPFKHIDSHGASVRYYEVEERSLVRPTWAHDSFETSLAQVPKMFRDPEEFRRQLASSTFYHVLNVDPRSPVRLPQPVRPASLPGKDGEDLIPCLYYMRETDRQRFEAVEDALRAAFPGFERLDFPPVAAGTLAMTWRDHHFPGGFYTHQLSEGALRFLWLTTLLQSPGLTAVTLIDEPEVSLHPELLSLFAELLREASQRSQIIVATHSDRLVRFLRAEEVVVMDIGEDGLASTTWADKLDLERWLEEYSLDEVWRMGRLGGRA
jgi:predicted ATPase